MAAYPSTFPCPMIEGFTVDVDAGLIRSKERGLPEQRRVHRSMPHNFKLKFALSIREWGYWQEWITKQGSGWFWIDLPSMYAGLAAQKTFPHMVRLSSTITIDTKTHTHITASLAVELAPSTFKRYLEAV